MINYKATYRNKEVVIARYKEDISWAAQLDACVVIYDKFLEPDSLWNNSSGWNDRIFSLPNVGNEAHTYLYHIVENYDNLADITFFVQGNPFDHSAKIVEKINHYDSVDEKGWFINLCDFVTTSGPNGEPHHPTNPINIMKYYWAITGEYEFPKEGLTFGSGAQFAVTKECIKKHPKSYYEQLLTFSLDDTKTTLGELQFPMIMERLWHKVFQ